MDAAEQKKQDDYLRSNIHHLIQQAGGGGAPRFSLFLDERQQEIAREILRHNRCEESALFFGGTENCERQMLGVFPEEIVPDSGKFPVCALRVTHSGRVSLTHRDYLGALMSLQLRRESLGDILPFSGFAVVFVTRDLAEFIRMNLTQIGRTSVSVEEIDGSGIEKNQEYEEIRGTVSSLRLDAVIALLTGKSRSAAAQTVEAGLVKLNGLEMYACAKVLRPGDKLSIRGAGKFILDEKMKKTKKDRLFITIRKLL